MLISGSEHESDAIPFRYEGVPPREISAKISVEAYYMVVPSKRIDLIAGLTYAEGKSV